MLDPSAAVTSTRKPSERSRATTETQAVMATSNAFSSAHTAGSKSTRTAAVRDWSRSSSRTMRSPWCAEARQCTRRIESPATYGRGMRLSVPCPVRSYFAG